MPDRIEVKPKDIMTPQQAAARLGVSRPTVYRFIREGALQSYHMTNKLGRKIVLRRDVDALKKRLAQGGVRATAAVRLERG